MESFNEMDTNQLNNRNSTAQQLTQDDYLKIGLEQEKRRQYMQKRRYNRLPLIFSLIGLLLTFVFGIGAVFAVIGLIMAFKRYRKAPSKPLRWAIVISLITVFICVIYVFCLFYAFILGALEIYSTTESLL